MEQGLHGGTASAPAAAFAAAEALTGVWSATFPHGDRGKKDSRRGWSSNWRKGSSSLVWLSLQQLVMVAAAAAERHRCPVSIFVYSFFFPRFTSATIAAAPGQVRAAISFSPGSAGARQEVRGTRAMDGRLKAETDGYAAPGSSPAAAPTAIAAYTTTVASGRGRGITETAREGEGSCRGVKGRESPFFCTRRRRRFVTSRAATKQHKQLVIAASFPLRIDASLSRILRALAPPLSKHSQVESYASFLLTKLSTASTSTSAAVGCAFVGAAAAPVSSVAASVAARSRLYSLYRRLSYPATAPALAEASCDARTALPTSQPVTALPFPHLSSKLFSVTSCAPLPGCSEQSNLFYSEADFSPSTAGAIVTSPGRKASISGRRSLAVATAAALDVAAARKKDGRDMEVVAKMTQDKWDKVADLPSVRRLEVYVDPRLQRQPQRRSSSQSREAAIAAISQRAATAEPAVAALKAPSHPTGTFATREAALAAGGEASATAAEKPAVAAAAEGAAATRGGGDGASRGGGDGGAGDGREVEMATAGAAAEGMKKKLAMLPDTFDYRATPAEERAAIRYMRQNSSPADPRRPCENDSLRRAALDEAQYRQLIADHCGDARGDGAGGVDAGGDVAEKQESFDPFLTPVWMMRQAGRYLPEFRAVRSRYSFIEVCRDPVLASEITLQPYRRFPLLDAVIIFTDILVIPEAMGMDVSMPPTGGPRLSFRIQTPAHIRKLVLQPNIEETLGYVLDAVYLTSCRLEGRIPLIGFCGAPLTLLMYMIEGGSSSTNWREAKTFLYDHRKASHLLLRSLRDACVEFLIRQADAGAQVLQVFDSHAGVFEPEFYEEMGAAYMISIAEQVKARRPHVVLMGFPKDRPSATFSQSAYDVISLSHTADILEMKQRFQQLPAVSSDIVTARSRIATPVPAIAGDTTKQRASDRSTATLAETSHPETPSVAGTTTTASNYYNPVGSREGLREGAGANKKRRRSSSKVDDIVEKTVTHIKALQGNLDPQILYTNIETITEETNKMIERFGVGRYIANLGHGMEPLMLPENAAAFLNAVKRASARLLQQRRK